MDHLEKLRASRDKESVSYKRFMELLERNKDAVFCFVEGEDSKYYAAKIESIEPSYKYHFINSKGKEGVLKLFRLITGISEYDLIKTLYFVDRDFDELIDNPHIYETPCYSIENLYTTKNTICRVLQREFQLDETDDDYYTALHAFSTHQSEFHDAMDQINAWIACHRDLSKQGITTRLNLSDLNPSNLVTVSLTGVTQKYSFDSLIEMFPHAAEIDQETLENKLRSFRSIDRQKWYRGKFELFFFKKFIEILSEDSNRRHPFLFSTKRKNQLQLSANVLSELSQYAEFPECLRTYVKRIISQDQLQEAIM
ncbi:hypothetical protein BBR47_35890 [Brevibacillus brevis NBRC 100599]|uniref:DUF4435 domain-containing protein n=1 Tax=Brevibacillus brevis (strain 47 / JCM 6285 / NBRC 100599) TaxID=358681 RepID=C0ZFK7_BREBN|nr:DUF4435 domain-containing protein [Brevibacillus brevis]BAH44566.1 hypothetical protein BBR47_35890 [Brevibacillus brevis NBRC 100599]